MGIACKHRSTSLGTAADLPARSAGNLNEQPRLSLYLPYYRDLAKLHSENQSIKSAGGIAASFPE